MTRRKNRGRPKKKSILLPPDLPKLGRKTGLTSATGAFTGLGTMTPAPTSCLGFLDLHMESKETVYRIVAKQHKDKGFRDLCEVQVLDHYHAQFFAIDEPNFGSFMRTCREIFSAMSRKMYAVLSMEIRLMRYSPCAPCTECQSDFDDEVSNMDRNCEPHDFVYHLRAPEVVFSYVYDLLTKIVIDYRHADACLVKDLQIVLAYLKSFKLLESISLCFDEIPTTPHGLCLFKLWPHISIKCRISITGEKLIEDVLSRK
ncbi:hypothetical protein ANO11243_051090 [Dothideomycetidae sp. 11243]|nr:hypothetical protein ANO11243_051090 [fungal sp. No.11243]